MQELSKIHLGLDVHKDSISIAVAEPGRCPGRLIGRTAHDVSKLLKVLNKVGAPEQLHIVYEAGPTGFGLQRALTARGYLCQVIAPSQIPRRAGDRVKTDSRDSIQLAECSRAGQLSSVWIPDPEDEAIRDLSRAREDAVATRTQLRQQLKSFLLRHDIRYSGKTAAVKACMIWMLACLQRHVRVVICAGMHSFALYCGNRLKLALRFEHSDLDCTSSGTWSLVPRGQHGMVQGR